MSIASLSGALEGESSLMVIIPCPSCFSFFFFLLNFAAPPDFRSRDSELLLRFFSRTKGGTYTLAY